MNMEKLVMIQIEHVGKVNPDVFTSNETKDAFWSLVKQGKLKRCDGEGNYEMQTL